MKLSTPLTKAVVAGALILISSAIQSRATTFTVTNTKDSGPGSLRQAVLDANAATTADTIVFDPSFFSTPRTITLATVIGISPTSQTIDTTTIVGPGPELLTISGNNVTDHFFTLAGDTATISGMTLTRGAGGDGGSIGNGGMTTLTDIVFAQNTSNSGGAIYNAGNGTTSGVLNIFGCVFRNNSATGTNINGDGGSALESNSGLVNITDSIMTDGTSRGGGGAIRNNGVMNITNTRISNNTSGGAGNSDGGGGINSTGQLTLTNCIISNNTAGEDTNGGGLDNEGQMTLINTVVTDNSATANGGGINNGATDTGDFLRVIDSTISNNTAGTTATSEGGGINVEGNPGLTITRSTISGNTTSGDGAGIWSDGQVVMDDCTVSGNSTVANFGGVRVPHNFSDSTITNSTIANNSAGSGGGVGRDNCNLSCRTLSIGNTIIANNTAAIEPDIRNRLITTTHSTPITSLGYNLIEVTEGTFISLTSTDITGVDPKLGSLQNNGGPAETHALQPGSPAIDKGKTSSELKTDQRGVTRPTDDPAIANAEDGDGSDIGAYEVGAPNGVAEKTLGNISTRLPVLTGENVPIAGFIVVGKVAKRVIIRGLGPSLEAGGVGGTLQNPTLQLFQGETLLASNNDWKDDQQAAIAATGVAPTDEREAAIVRTLKPGSYTAVLRGKDGTTGIGLVEVYDLNQRPNSKLANISTRGFIGTGENVLVGGFIVGPTTRVLVRAVGPSLANSGVEGALQDPTLQLVDANGDVIRANDNWKGIQQHDIEATGAQPSNDRESALVETLTAGNYTAVVRGAGETTGIGLVEVYNLP